MQNLNASCPIHQLRALFVRRLTCENIDLFLEDLYISLYSSDMRGIDINELLTLMNNVTNRHFRKKMLSRKQFKMSNNPWISEILASY